MESLTVDKFRHRYDVLVQSAYLKEGQNAKRFMHALKRTELKPATPGKSVPREILRLLVSRNEQVVNLGLAQFTKDREALSAVYRSKSFTAVLANPRFGEVYS